MAATFPFSATPEEAARLTGLTKTRIYELLQAGTIEARRSGRRTLVLMDGVRKHVEGLPKVRLGRMRGEDVSTLAAQNAEGQGLA